MAAMTLTSTVQQKHQADSTFITVYIEVYTKPIIFINVILIITWCMCAGLMRLVHCM